VLTTGRGRPWAQVRFLEPLCASGCWSSVGIFIFGSATICSADGRPSQLIGFWIYRLPGPPSFFPRHLAWLAWTWAWAGWWLATSDESAAKIRSRSQHPHTPINPSIPRPRLFTTAASLLRAWQAANQSHLLQISPKDRHETHSISFFIFMLGRPPWK